MSKRGYQSRKSLDFGDKILFENADLSLNRVEARRQIRAILKEVFQIVSEHAIASIQKVCTGTDDFKELLDDKI